MRLLIVDDSITMRMIIMRSIRQSGFKAEEILEARNGREALDIIGSNHIDIILSDINMPEMDGLEFLKRLRSSPDTRDIPVVMITAEGSESLIEKAEGLGASGFIRKPFTPESIGSKLSEILK